MYQIFMQCPSEYDAALVLLGSFAHWQKLCKTQWFTPHITKWREQMAIRDCAIGQSTIYLKALQGDVSAGKQLLANHKVVGATAKDNNGSKSRPNQSVPQRDVEIFLKAGRNAINERRKRES
jgi:hypothetical protein